MSRPIKSLPALPVERALKAISGRWKALLLYHLIDRPRRLVEMCRLLPDVHEKVLIQQLRELEEHGLIRRKLAVLASPRVQYEATEIGRRMSPILNALCEWGRAHAHALADESRMQVACEAYLGLQQGEEHVVAPEDVSVMVET